MHHANAASSSNSIPNAVRLLFGCLLHTPASWEMVRILVWDGIVSVNQLGQVSNSIPISINPLDQTVLDDSQYLAGLLRTLAKILEAISFLSQGCPH